MKQIQEYLLSKKNNKANVFHLDVKKGALKTQQDVIDFFEYNGFKRINSDSLESFIEKFENSSAPVYWTGIFSSYEMTQWVRFGKGGKITKDNPVMFWRLNEVNKDYCGYNYYYATGPKNTTATDIHVIKSFDEFKEFVNKIF